VIEKWLWMIFHLPSLRAYTVLEFQRVVMGFPSGPIP
jgi:hypothetical protein